MTKCGKKIIGGILENKLIAKLKYTMNLYIPTNVVTVFHSGLTSSPLQALT